MRNNKYELGFLSAIVLACVSLLSPAAADTKIGVVDTNKVFNDSLYIKAQLASLDTFQKEQADLLQQKLASLAYGMLLTDQELADYRQITAKPEADRSPAELEKIKNLQSLSDARTQEMERLQQATGQPTPEQKARLAELNLLYQACTLRQDEAQKTYDTIQGDLDKKRTDVNDNLMKELDQAIAAVAQNENLGIVLQKSLVVPMGQDNQEVPFCLYVNPLNDMTDPVLKALEAAHASPAEAPQSSPQEAPKTP